MSIHQLAAHPSLTTKVTSTATRPLRLTCNTRGIFLSADTTFLLSFQRYFFLLHGMKGYRMRHRKVLLEHLDVRLLEKEVKRILWLQSTYGFRFFACLHDPHIWFVHLSVNSHTLLISFLAFYPDSSMFAQSYTTANISSCCYKHLSISSFVVLHGR